MPRPDRRPFLLDRCLTLWTIIIAMMVSGGALAETIPDARLQAFSGDGANERYLQVMKRVNHSHVRGLVGAERWRQLQAKFESDIVSSKKHADFACALNEMFNESAISHFRYVTDRDWSYWHLRGDWEPMKDAAKVAHVGLVTENISGKWYVRGILENSPAAQQRILVGDEIVAVDGSAYAQANSFKGKAHRSVVVQLRRDMKTSYEVTLTPVRENYALAIRQAMIHSVRVVEHENKKFAYAHVWTLLAPSTVFDRLSILEDEVDGLLLDFRDGVGGHSQSAMYFLLGDQSPSGSVPRITPWKKPVVILTDSGTRSAKEIVVDAVKRFGRAVMVGTPTPGAVSAVDTQRTGTVGGDGFLMLPWFRFSLEGHPIHPDFLIQRPLPYCAGDDPQMALAKDVLKASLVAH